MNKKTTNIYALCVRPYKGATPDARFTFTAKDDKEAGDKARDWAQYQSMSYYTDDVNKDRSDVSVRLATESEQKWETHNEYID